PHTPARTGPTHRPTAAAGGRLVPCASLHSPPTRGGAGGSSRWPFARLCPASGHLRTLRTPSVVGYRFTKELARQPVRLIIREAARPPPVEDCFANECRPKVPGVHVTNGPLGSGRRYPLDEFDIFRTESCEMERKLTWRGP